MGARTARTQRDEAFRRADEFAEEVRETKKLSTAQKTEMQTVLDGVLKEKRGLDLELKQKTRTWKDTEKKLLTDKEALEKKVLADKDTFDLQLERMTETVK